MKKVAFLLGASIMLIASITPGFANQFQRNHPRRAQVLNRANQDQQRLNNNKGHLGGNYGKLARENNNIRRQEQRDARRNGGAITPGQQRQLNKEENHLNRQINRDRQ